MPPTRVFPTEPIPGYRLIAPLGRGGFGEVWKCEAPGGFFKAIKFVQGNDDLTQVASGARQELRALEHLKALRHPFLLSIERVEVVGTDLLIVTELADKSLHDLLDENRKLGRSGVRRGDLLAYLFEAAEVLDVMNQEHGLQHLDIKPRNLFVVGKHVKVADFGLVASLTEIGLRKSLLGGLTPLYAAPETFDGRASSASDQYSLAVTYHELITGVPVYQARTLQQLAFLVLSTEPDLSKLAEEERPIVARALSKDPRKRFSSCTAFLQALAGVASLASASGQHRSCSTSFEFSLGELGTTAVPPAGSAVLRRDSKLVPVTHPPASGSRTLEGLTLLECLGRGPTGEHWLARTQEGQDCLIRYFIPPRPAESLKGAASTPPGQSASGGFDTLDRLLALVHRTLPQLQVFPQPGERIALLSEVGETSLGQRYKDCKANGQPGIPRLELLGHLANFSQALDELYDTYGLQHLALTPRHLALVRGEPLLLEFAHAELLWIPMGQCPGALNPRYAAPELFLGLVSDSCDQYSLALIYSELLVGQHPFRNLNARQMASPKLRGLPDVSLLPAPDRRILERALHSDPSQRFRSCREFLLALEQGTYALEDAAATVSTKVQDTHVVAAPTTHCPGLDSSWRSALEELVHAASHGHGIHQLGLVHYRLAQGHHIEHRAWARLAPGMARLKILGFREQWHAELLEESQSSWTFEVPVKSNLWQRCLGRNPALLVEIVLGAPRESAGHMTPVRITINPLDCGRGRAVQLLTDTGPAVLCSLQNYLNSQSTRDGQERFPLQQLIQLDSTTGGFSITGQLRDLGSEGLTLLSGSIVPRGAVKLSLNRWASPLTFSIPAVVRECRPCADQQFEVEVEYLG